MGNCLACRRRSEAKVISHKAVVPLNQEEQELSRTADHASRCTTTAVTACSKPKRSVRFAEEPVAGGGGGADKGEKCGGVRVRVVLTKKEAAQLLSRLVAEDNEQSLKSISAGKLIIEGEGGRKSRRGLLKQVPGCESFWRPDLESIPENC